MNLLTALFGKKNEPEKLIEEKKEEKKPKRDSYIAERKGVIGEYKIDIQLSQLPKNYKYINDLFIKNPKSKSGYSQIDHVLITPYGIFVIETKNYQGIIYGKKEQKNWLINGKYKMLNPLIQNYGHIESIKLYLDKRYQPYFISLVSFTKRCTLKIDTEQRKISSNELVIYDIELTEYINRKISVLKLQNKEPFISDSEITTIYQSLLDENVEDNLEREKHVKILSEMIETGVSESEGKCVICNKPVSDKVKSFCLSNKKFNGTIYCYEHQKANI